MSNEWGEERVGASFEDRQDVAVAAVLPLVLAALAVLHLAVAVAVLVEGTARDAGSAAVQGAAALAFAGSAAWTLRRPFPRRWASPAVCVASGLSILAGVLAMVITRHLEPAPVLSVSLVLAAASLLVVEWVVLVGVLAWAGLAIGMLAAVPGDRVPVLVATHVGASAAAAALLLVRRRTHAALGEALDLAEAATVRDALTGLTNRRGLAMLGNQIVETARRQGDAMHCVFVDLDGFGVVNERLGREVGDEVLVAVAEVMRQSTRTTDVVARWGGDEFCIVGPGPGTAPLELERRVRERLLAIPAVPLEIWDPKVSAGGSMLAPWDSGSLDTLLSKADQEMYLRRAVRREGSPLPRRRVREQ